MRIYYDLEFFDSGRTIDLISIGMVADDGRELYAINAELPYHALVDHTFLRENVAPHLPVRLPETDGWECWDFQHPDMTKVMYRNELRKAISAFVAETPDPELWAYYSAYDHVGLAQIFGRMLDLPSGIPMQTDDLMTEWKRLGRPALPQQAEDAQTAIVHHALHDARWNKTIGDFLTAYEAEQNRPLRELLEELASGTWLRSNGDQSWHGNAARLMNRAKNLLEAA
ncbi:3'-5' exoribonuclease domain-containing protein [Streptosporangium sp. NPDC050855]|uniref:3'-5' exoribonuclease domain-containing protein n=1 Tax=Streptosporangium sp. NPDC050855 TaxID=3366194 RepID=UPI00379D8D76